MPHRNKNKRTGSHGDILREVQNFLDKNFDETFTKAQLVKSLRLSDKKHISSLFTAIDQLERTGKILTQKDGSFKSAFAPAILEGVIDHVNPRFAYAIVGDGREDIIILKEKMADAFDGDRVKLMIVPSKRPRNDSREEGEVIEVIKRKREEFVGKIEVLRHAAYVVPDFKKVFYDFLVETNDINGAKTGDKVVVKITDWDIRKKNPKAKVIRVLGRAGEHNVEMHSIMAEFGLPFEFPSEVEKDAEKIDGIISEEEIKKRRDFRDVLTFTIDPVDAKDFDDAISVRKLSENTWEIGVHIADVTHYVTPGTRLEDEAYKRATSIYLVDRVIPMLPEKLSNNLCSLVPNQDRLTFSAVFEMDENANIKKEWFGRTIIHSDTRFSYEEVQEIIDNKGGKHYEAIDLLHKLHIKLRNDRFKNGAINFETVEVKFKLDEKGVPLGVFPKIRKDSHKVVEEFMLLANRQVARFVYNFHNGKEKNVMVYRTHDQPDVERLRSFAMFAKKFGHKLEAESKNISKDLNQLMEDVQGKPEQNMLENLAVRAMAKAKYTTDANQHFGLAFDHYSHFTSPIRRYPDMMAHRLLEMYLHNSVKGEKKSFEEQCKHSSDMEKVAAEAERASIKYKQAEYMARMIGQSFDGIVSGITEWGIFVEITDTKCEGLVRYQDIKEDFYDLDQINMRAIGRKHHKVITFGDKVRVTVKGTDLDKRTIDLVFESII
ncbi:MAG: ribonuclease R [Bacteroidota bacterium]|nr:ribonuclease R [Bacteroidota bacterium]